MDCLGEPFGFLSAVKFFRAAKKNSKVVSVHAMTPSVGTGGTTPVILNLGTR